MSKKKLYTAWGGLFVVCAALGFVPEPEGFLRWALTALGVVFFVPPALVCVLAAREGDCQALRLVRNLSAWSLGLTLGLLVANFLSALGSPALGDVLHSVLTIVSSPMVCCGYWALSLFLWACLLMGSIQALGKCRMKNAE